MSNQGGLIGPSPLSDVVASEPLVQCVAPNAGELHDDSSVHSIHDFDHSELVERAEIVGNIDNVSIGARRCHRHRQH